MPLLGRAKRRLAHKLGSGATHGEGTQNILCGYLAVAVLAGLLGNTLLGWWWLDPIAALAIAALAVREGRRELARRELRLRDLLRGLTERLADGAGQYAGQRAGRCHRSDDYVS